MGLTALRLLSWNVRSLRDDAAAVARVIRNAAPDVVCVQEAPGFARWRSKRAALARESGLVVVGGPRAGGVGVLAAIRVAVRATADVRLSPTPGRHRRALALATLELAGTRFGVVSFHLGLDPVERQRHVPELARAVERFGELPVVLAGDVNEEPGGSAYAAIAAHWPGALVPGATFPSRAPRRRIDAVFADQRIAVRELTVLDGEDVVRASDHRPLLAVIDLPPAVATEATTAAAGV